MQYYKIYFRLAVIKNTLLVLVLTITSATKKFTLIKTTKAVVEHDSTVYMYYIYATIYTYYI